MNIKDYKENNLGQEHLDEITVELMKASLDKHYASRWAEVLKQEHRVTKQSTQMEGVFHNRNRYWVAGLAASVLLCMGLFFYLNRATATTSMGTEELLAQYLDEPYPSEIGRGQVDSSEVLRKRAQVQYSKRNWTAAIDNYRQIDESALIVEDYFFLGLSELYNEAAGAAVQTLSKAQDLDDDVKGDFKQHIDWYLALAHLKKGDKVDGQSLLQQIVDEKYWIKEEAKKLLKSLEKT